MKTTERVKKKNLKKKAIAGGTFIHSQTLCPRKALESGVAVQVVVGKPKGFCKEMWW